MDLGGVSNQIKGTDLLNRSGVTLFLVCTISVIALYYARAVDNDTERSALLAEAARYEPVAQTELQHLIDLIYRSSDRSYSPDTPAISNSFPWVRSIGLVDGSETRNPKASHILALSLAESSQSLGGQVTFAVLDKSDVLLVLAKPNRDHTVRAIFSVDSLLSFINDQVNLESLGVGINLLPGAGTENIDTLTTTLHLGLPGLEFEARLVRNDRSPGPVNEAVTLAWLLIGALWVTWLLLFLERRRRLQNIRLIEEQKQRIEGQAARSTLAEITSSIGHEINQPVAAIESLADTASILMSAGKTADATDTLQKLQAEATRVGQIIQTIRRLSSQRGLALIRLDIRQVVKEFEPFARIVCREANLKLELPAPSQAIEVFADRTALEQVITNLLTNAREAVSAGAGERTHKPSISLALYKTDRHAVIRVTDDGPGIPEELRGDVFNSFMTTKPDGVGLGLNLSRSIAEKHHGWLDLTETGSNGTTFELRLPLANS
jgi:signal transduction histidine kinase